MSAGQPWVVFPRLPRGSIRVRASCIGSFAWQRGRAGITKRVGVHTLRHCFATHLLEQKTDIRIIPGFIGDIRKLDTTALYTRGAIHTIGPGGPGPLDFLRKDARLDAPGRCSRPGGSRVADIFRPTAGRLGVRPMPAM